MVRREDLTWSDFIIATDHEDISTWHLPWHFSSIEKTKEHLRDALARFNQVEGLSADEKHEAYTKLVHLCKKYGIHVSEKDEQRFTVWAKKNDDRDDDQEGNEEQTETQEPDGDGCECECSACMADNCMNCASQDCVDEDCMDCPMQKTQDEDGDTMDVATTAVQAETSTESVAAEESNLSLYEARLKMLRIA